MTASRFDHYDWSGGREATLRFGPEHGPTVLAAAPLFEEANRTRASLVAVLRRLAERGIGSALPDLPGTNDSLVPTDDATLKGWRDAFAAAARALPGPIHVMSWRGGALVDGEAEAFSRWRLSPVSGPDMIRDLRRAQATAGGELFAGNRLSTAMVAALETGQFSVIQPLRVVRLDTDPRAGDARLPGRPLWRAAEPGTDPELEAAIADDITVWIARCGG